MDGTNVDDRAERAAPLTIIEALDASARDIAAGAVSDASDVQAEMRRMLVDHERRTRWPGGLREQPSAPGRHDVACRSCSHHAWFAAWRSSGFGVVAFSPGLGVSSWKSWWQSFMNSWSSHSWIMANFSCIACC